MSGIKAFLALNLEHAKPENAELPGLGKHNADIGFYGQTESIPYSEIDELHHCQFATGGRIARCAIWTYLLIKLIPPVWPVRPTYISPGQEK